LGVAGPHDYDAVNQAAKSLHLSKYGHVVYTGHYGSAHRIEGNPPTVIKDVLGDETTYPSLLAELPRAGYKHLGGNAWSRKSGKTTLLVAFTELKSGDSYIDADGKRHVVPAPGADISIASVG
jgi:hypothetical protein